MLEVLVGLFGSLILGVFGFIYQAHTEAERRLTRMETKYDDIKMLMDAKFELILVRLERIERVMNGSLKGFPNA